MNISILKEINTSTSTVDLKNIAKNILELTKFALKNTIDNDRSAQYALNYMSNSSSYNFSLTTVISKNGYSNHRCAMHYKKYCIKANLDCDIIDKTFLLKNERTVKFVGSSTKKSGICAIYTYDNKSYSYDLTRFMASIMKQI